MRHDTAWQPKLGDLKVIREIDCETPTQDLVRAQVCGPVEILVEGFEPVYGEVLFIDVRPADGLFEPLLGCNTFEPLLGCITFEPLLGYIPLEQCQAAVDMLGRRLLHAKMSDLK